MVGFPTLKGTIAYLLTLTLTLNRIILHTVVHHSSTFTYVANFIEIEKNFFVDKLKPGLVASHDLWPENGMGLFGKK